jgi:hypothetical protein
MAARVSIMVLTSPEFAVLYSLAQEAWQKWRVLPSQSKCQTQRDGEPNTHGSLGGLQSFIPLQSPNPNSV